jgi:hypothetical protein
MEQLTPRLDQRTQEEETMQRARADWEAATRQLGPLEQSYQEQWAPYDTERKKLERLRKHRWFVRFVIQAWTDEWEKDLKETVQKLATPLHRLTRQMDALRRDQARALDTSQQARQRWDTLAQLSRIGNERATRGRPPR